jgi:putative FmdB family regulatory protein
MPIYEYRCDEGHVFETFQSITDEALTACTECGAPAQRVLNAPAIHFKGSGFYTTDYGSKSRGRSASADGDSSASSNGSESSSSSNESSSSSDSGAKSSGDTTKSAA